MTAFYFYLCKAYWVRFCYFMIRMQVAGEKLSCCVMLSAKRLGILTAKGQVTECKRNRSSGKDVAMVFQPARES